MAVLAFVPTNPGKLAALVAVWALTFGSLGRVEAVFFAVACVFFTGMNAASLAQGIFAFTEPDVLRMPVWELFMWGFYLLHTRRVLGGKAAHDRRGAVWALALGYSAAFATIHDGTTLLAVTGTLLALGLILFHEREDLAYTGYMVVLGALIEYSGVLSGNWTYPGNPPGGVPLWFVTLWGGVGLFMRRLVLPILERFEGRPPARGLLAAAPQA
ncbi:DUF2878 family protein [Massilia niastensis]|uniref:DUF2878 family protein n=1 Tax=Massilia niastensis TaxID=544911 RepID=UPI00035CB774|nr:DUF2878 family protein [Massilia niastensis]